MAFITTEQVKEKRNLLKKNFPSKEGWKFSVTRKNCSSINVKILKAPLSLLSEKCKEQKYENVNPYYIDNHYVGIKKEILSKIYTIINTDNYDRSDNMTDYFDVGFYVNISIGSWDKPFMLSHTKQKK